MSERGWNERPGRLRRRAVGRRGGVAILFATAIIPLLAMVGLAIDYSIYNQIVSSLEIAADTAALNAARIAGNAEVAGEAQTQYLNDGTTAGQKWFAAVATYENATVTPAVSVTGSTTITAKVTFTGTVPSIFGKILYHKLTYPLSGEADATVGIAPFLDVEILMDNSSSMQQGATAIDIENMDYWSACSNYGAFQRTQNSTTTPSLDGQVDYGTPANYSSPYSYPISGNKYFPYENYTTTFAQKAFPENGGYRIQTNNPLGSSVYNPNFPGAVPYPIPIRPPSDGTSPDSGYGSNGTSLTAFPAPASTTSEGGPICYGFNNAKALASPYGLQTAVTTPVRAGEPCAFACHTDTSTTAGQGNDLYGLARQTIGTNHPVTLRFDLVKTAVNAILTNMQADDLSIRNLAVGVFTFNDVLTQIYPAVNAVCSSGAPTGEACDDWATAIADVGLPPTTKGGADTGIQAETLVGDAVHYDTDFTGTMTTLQQTYLKTASGDGSTAANPRKVLFLVTDGIDEANGTHTAFDYTQCAAFKSKGYTIYVAYTPYAPYPDFWYQQVQSIVEGSGSGSVIYNLEQCATGTTSPYFVQVTPISTLNSVLAGFLKSALNQPARFTH